MRGTKGDFKCDIESSDKNYGFILSPVNEKIDIVAVFESPIDALSHQTIYPDFTGWRLSLGCTSDGALLNFLKRKNVSVK